MSLPCDHFLLRYAVSAEIVFSADDLRLLAECSRQHADFNCQAASFQKGQQVWEKCVGWPTNGLIVTLEIARAAASDGLLRQVLGTADLTLLAQVLAPPPPYTFSSSNYIWLQKRIAQALAACQAEERSLNSGDRPQRKFQA